MKDYVHKTYGIGTKAYLDAFTSGLVPCQVTAINDKEVSAVVTKDHKAYHKGETVTHSHSAIFPRDRLFTRGMFYRINTQYAWKA